MIRNATSTMFPNPDARSLSNTRYATASHLARRTRRWCCASRRNRRSSEHRLDFSIPLRPAVVQLRLRRKALTVWLQSFRDMATIHDEDVLGKAYDSRLMKRLLTYLRPYRWQVVVALIAIILKAGADVLGPYLTKVAIDKYLANRTEAHSLLDPFLSSQPLVGIAQISAIYIGLLLVSFLFEFTQSYIMQWVGQKVMFDLRAQIFRHLQRLHISFFDHNPVGRLVTRVTSDVDALNEMFTAGVVSIFED